MKLTALTIWLIVFVVLLLAELTTVGLTTIWFAIGALVSLISVTVFNPNWYIQLIIFIVVSVVSLITLRPIAVKYFNKNKIKTNVEEIAGKTATITKAILDVDETGEAKLDGEIWMAKSGDSNTFVEGEKVKVKAVEGVKLIVEKEN